MGYALIYVALGTGTAAFIADALRAHTVGDAIVDTALACISIAAAAAHLRRPA